jgi:hypothetical protein
VIEVTPAGSDRMSRGKMKNHDKIREKQLRKKSKMVNMDDQRRTGGQSRMGSQK